MNTMNEQSAAPTLRMPVPPAPPQAEGEPNVAAVHDTPKPKRGGRKPKAEATKRGPKRLTAEETAQRAAERDRAREQRAAAEADERRALAGMARLSAIGAISPELLEADEVQTVCRFAAGVLKQRLGQ
jgi:hypothetical protein